MGALTAGAQASGPAWATVWTALGAVAALTQTVIVMLALLYARRQIEDAKRSRNLVALHALRDTFDTAEARSERWRLHNELPDDLTGTLSTEHTLLLESIVAKFNFAGSLLDRGLDFELLALTHARPIARNWIRLEPWVSKRREQRGDFVDAFRILGNRCVDWDRDMHPTDPAQPYRETSQRGSFEVIRTPVDPALRDVLERLAHVLSD